MDDDNNSENKFKNKNKDLFDLRSIFSQLKINKDKNDIFQENRKKEIIFTNNFLPFINIKTPVLNINNKNKETENNQNNLYKIKSKRNKFIKKKD